MNPASERLASVVFGRFRVLRHGRELLADGETVKLGRRAFDVVMALMEARRPVVDKDALMTRVLPDRIVDGAGCGGANRGVTMRRYRELSKRKSTAFQLLLAVWLVFSCPIAADAAAGPPTEVVRNFYGVLLDLMQHAAALGPRGRYQKLEPVVSGTFDVPFMARLSVGPTWRSLTVEQKRRAVQAYSRYIAAIYATRFDDYAGEQFKVLGEQQIKHGTLIKTQIIKSNGEPVAINYVVHDNDIAWQIRDIYLSGSISELATRRSDFATILRTSGIDGLIGSLNKKADDLQS